MLLENFNNSDKRDNPVQSKLIWPIGFVKWSKSQIQNQMKLRTIILYATKYIGKISSKSVTMLLVTKNAFWSDVGDKLLIVNMSKNDIN